MRPRKLNANSYSDDFWIRTPLQFVFEDKSILDRAYKKLLNGREQIKEIWVKESVSEEVLKNLWPRWIQYSEKVYSQGRPFIFSHSHMIHWPLFEDLS